MKKLPLPTLVEKGGVSMDFDTFMLSVVAGIVAYYVCKWLDDDMKQR